MTKVNVEASLPLGHSAGVKFSTSFPLTTNWCQTIVDKIKIKGEYRYVTIHHGKIEEKKIVK